MRGLEGEYENWDLCKFSQGKWDLGQWHLVTNNNGIGTGIWKIENRVGWKMGFGQNLGWEMGFCTLPPFKTDPQSLSRFLYDSIFTAIENAYHGQFMHFYL